MIMRHNKYLQEMADRCAMKHGFLCAEYIGKSGEMFVYEPVEMEWKEPTKSFPEVITIKNNRVQFHQSMKSILILSETKRHYRKRKNIIPPLS